VVISDDRMSAEIHCKKIPKGKAKSFLSEENLLNFLNEYKITFGIDQKVVQLIAKNKISIKKFPMTIARGIPPKKGTDGSITYKLDYSSEVDRNSNWNFRDIMRIPSVKANQKLATITLPTKGEEGINVLGQKLKAQHGKPIQINAGINVIFNEDDLSFYSSIDGQVSITERDIKVHPVYEVNESLSMKTGNLDFVGSIIIKGDVPTGYTVKAKGDIKIFGIVEAATIISGGSVFVAEGLAGLQKGTIKAEENIHIGYINQGIVHANDSVYVENSIIHSEITANKQVFCQKGNIIGGSLSAGQLIEAKDIGNRLSTKTHITLGINQLVHDKKNKLLTKKKELDSTLTKLKTIGEKLNNRQHDAKTRITLLRQRHSTLKVMEEMKEIDSKLAKMNAFLGSEKKAKIIVQNTIYPNVMIAFGKYKHNVNRMHKRVNIKLDQNEIVIRALED